MVTAGYIVALLLGCLSIYNSIMQGKLARAFAAGFVIILFVMAKFEILEDLDMKSIIAIAVISFGSAYYGATRIRFTKKKKEKHGRK